MMKRMGIRRAGHQDEQLEGAIDIVFLLLIFFVLTSSFQILVGAKIKPPKKFDEELVIDNNKDIVLKIDPLSQVVLIYQKQEYPLVGDALFQDGTAKLSAFLSVPRISVTREARHNPFCIWGAIFYATSLYSAKAGLAGLVQGGRGCDGLPGHFRLLLDFPGPVDQFLLLSPFEHDSHGRGELDGT